MLNGCSWTNINSQLKPIFFEIRHNCIVRIGKSGYNQYQTNEGEPYKDFQSFEYFQL